MTRRNVTPLGALGRGVLAGAVGTAAMTAWQELSSKLESSGEDSEGNGGDREAEPQDPWENAPVPAQVGRRVIEGVFRREVPPDWVPALTQGMHWAYGTVWGAAYGLLQGTRGRGPLRTGLVFGTGVWVMSYVQLVPMGLYEPPWKYPPRQLGLDLSYHLAYGAGLGSGYAALERALGPG